MNNQIMIKIEQVSKRYRLGMIGGTTLREDLQRFAAKIRKKEDPTTKVGQKLNGNIGDSFNALTNVSLEIREGEAVGIIGHNGAGKSTLLKLITRITAPTTGYIGLNGRIASMLEVGTGFHPELTGRENIYMNGAILGMTKKEIDSKIDEIIEFSEISKFIDTPVKRYSSGMYVKLAFSVAAHLDSEIIIMDEVLAVGDMAFQKKCINRMKEAARQEGKTVLYVSHNMETIRQLCDRCIVLDHGRIIFDGEVEEGIEQYLDARNDNRVYYDLINLPRSANEKRQLEFLSLKIENVDVNRFNNGDSILMSITAKCNQDVEDVGLRFEIHTVDGRVIGTTFLDHNISAKIGDIVQVQTRLATKNIAPGRYTATGLLFESDQFGNQIGIDRVDPAFSFEILNNEDNKLEWLSNYWGNVRFDDMESKISVGGCEND